MEREREEHNEAIAALQEENETLQWTIAEKESELEEKERERRRESVCDGNSRRDGVTEERE